jgi:hypothetical protein
MDFKVRIDKHSKHIITHLNNFDEAIDFIKENDCNGVQLGGIVGDEDIIPDFSRFQELADKLIWISFSMHQRAKKIDNFDGIYSLKKLKFLYLNDKEKFTIDVAKFKNLIYLGGEYWEGIQNIDKSLRLETIVLSHYVKTDVCEFKALSNLEILHLYTSKIKNLDCIESLPNLKELRLARDQELKDISALFASKSIAVLKIEKCKHLTKGSLFAKLNTIRELYLDEIDSLSFVPAMPKLEKLTFLDCKDGKMEPLLKAPRLKDVSFYPNKKHYSHTKEEIQGLLGARK